MDRVTKVVEDFYQTEEFELPGDGVDDWMKIFTRLQALSKTKGYPP